MADTVLLVPFDDVKQLLSIQDHLPWDQRSEMLIALKQALANMPTVAAIPDQVRQVGWFKATRELVGWKMNVASGLAVDLELFDMKRKVLETAPPSTGVFQQQEVE